MKTRLAILAALGIAAAATAIFLRTDRGKKMKDGFADNLLSWKDRLAGALDHHNGTENKNTRRRTKQIKEA